MGIMDFGQSQDQMPQDDTMMQLELQRRLRFADALRQQEAPQGQMVSGHYVAPSFTQNLANLYGKYQAGQQEQGAMKQYGEYETAKSKKLSDLLTNKEMMNVIKKIYLSVDESIKLVHFNNLRPEYKNIYITNLKDNYAYVYDGERFVCENKHSVLTELLDNHSYNIETFVNNNKDKIPQDILNGINKFLYKINEDTSKIYDDNNKEYDNFESFKINKIKLLVYNLSNGNKTNLINVICN
jgi:hypothetical protein